MDSFGGPSASPPRTRGNTKNYVAFGATSDEQPLLRDGVAPSFFNRIIGRKPRDLARSALRLSLVLGFAALMSVAAIGMMADSSSTTTDAVALSTPLGSSAQAVALSAPLGHPPNVNRTFTVYTCGIPDVIKQRHIPWDICRVKLVGCPGGGSGCRHWRYEDGLEMTATGTARNSYTITTDIYEPGKGG